MSGPKVDPVHDYEMPWVRDAACAGHDPELWFPSSRSGDNGLAAKAICATCRVREECLEYAVETVQTHGIWGGSSPLERRRIRAQRTGRVA